MPARTDQSSTRRRVRKSASVPDGCLSETTQTVPTRYGAVTVRVRRFPELYRVGGHAHPFPGHRIEVAVNAPQTDGFRVIDGHYLDGQWSQPADDLAVHVEFGARIMGEVDREAERRAAGDRRPQRRPRVVRPAMPSAPGMDEPGPVRSPAPTRPSTAPERVTRVRTPKRRGYASPGAALHAYLGALDVGDHYAYASDVLGRAVTSFGALSRADLHAVRAYADRQRAGVTR